MKKIAVVFGGYSGEAEISEKSARNVLRYIDRSQYNPMLVEICNKEWKVEVDDQSVVVNKHDFSYLHHDVKESFDAVLMMVHGSPGENGLLQGYFSMLNIPVTTGDVLNMALTFNKYATITQLAKLGFKVAKSFSFNSHEGINYARLGDEIGFPCFVKPNEAGSSLGISRVNSESQLESAVKKAFKVGKTVMVEAFLSGREISCGIIPTPNGIKAMPATEVITENEFFDYEAKYQGKSEEITPANITTNEMNLIQSHAKEIYLALNCHGFLRVDFMLEKGVPSIIEVNTVPGFSEKSILPQQIQAAGIDMKDAINWALNEALT